MDPEQKRSEYYCQPSPKCLKICNKHRSRYQPMVTFIRVKFNSKATGITHCIGRTIFTGWEEKCMFIDIDCFTDANLTNSWKSNNQTCFCSSSKDFGFANIRNIIGRFEHTKCTTSAIKRVCYVWKDEEEGVAIVLTLLHGQPVPEYVHDQIVEYLRYTGNPRVTVVHVDPQSSQRIDHQVDDHNSLLIVRFSTQKSMYGWTERSSRLTYMTSFVIQDLIVRWISFLVVTLGHIFLRADRIYN